MKDKYIIIVDPYSSGALYADILKKNNIQPIAVLSSEKPPDVYSKSFIPNDYAITYYFDSYSEIELIHLLRKFDPIAILTGCESGVKIAELIAPKILPDRSNSAELAMSRWHKGEMNKAITNANLPNMKQICSNSITEIHEWIVFEKLQGKDLIIKPPASASTDSVTLVKNGVGWEAIFNKMIGVNNRLGRKNTSLMIQEFLTGKEYAVDVITYAGKHSICSICLYNKVQINGVIGIYESMRWLSLDFKDCEIIINYATNVLDALGIMFGVSHIEIMMTDDGPKLIEIGARPHGGGHPKYSKKAVGDSQIERIVQSYIYGELSDKKYDLKCQMIVVFFICENDCYIFGLQKLEKLKKLDSFFDMRVNIKEGDDVNATSDLFSSLDLGFVVLSHTDTEVIKNDYLIVRSLEKEIYVDKNFARS